MCKYLFFHFRLATVLIVVIRTKWVGEGPESAGAIVRVLSDAAISLLPALFTPFQIGFTPSLCRFHRFLPPL